MKKLLGTSIAFVVVALTGALVAQASETVAQDTAVAMVHAPTVGTYYSEDLQLCGAPEVLTSLSSPEMSDCCRYRIEGCGKEENVCVSGDCNSGTLKKARKAFADKHSCKGNKKTGQTGDRCKSNKCTMKI